MKKLIPILAVITLLISCNKDDVNGSVNLDVTPQNIAGVWFPSKVVKTNGNIEDVTRLCATARDTIRIFVYGRINTKIYFNCDYYEHYFGCSNFYIRSNNKIESCSSIFEGYVTELTDQKMRIDYEEPVDALSTHNMSDMKAMIYTRK